jgi:thioredoxin-dependent peroxiredoxin
MNNIIPPITFKNKTIHTNKLIPKLKEKAPNFNLIDKELNNKSLSDFKGIKLLSFNPSFDTSVCSKTAKYFNSFAKNHPEITIILISKDLPFAQKRFCDTEKLDNVITLSLMQSDQAAKDYGVLIEDGPIKGLTARAIFLLDKDDRIIYSELVSEVTNEPNYGILERFLAQ